MTRLIGSHLNNVLRENHATSKKQKKNTVWHKSYCKSLLYPYIESTIKMVLHSWDMCDRRTLFFLVVLWKRPKCSVVVPFVCLIDDYTIHITIQSVTESSWSSIIYRIELQSIPLEPCAMTIPFCLPLIRSCLYVRAFLFSFSPSAFMEKTFSECQQRVIYTQFALQIIEDTDEHSEDKQRIKMKRHNKMKVCTTTNSKCYTLYSYAYHSFTLVCLAVCVCVVYLLSLLIETPTAVEAQKNMRWAIDWLMLFWERVFIYVRFSTSSGFAIVHTKNLMIVNLERWTTTWNERWFRHILLTNNLSTRKQKNRKTKQRARSDKSIFIELRS